MQLLKNLLVDRLGRRDDAFGWREFDDTLPMERVRSLCLLHTDAKLGDAIVNSLLVDALGKARPEVEITMGTTKAFAPYWEAHPAVARAIAFPDRDRGGPFERLRAARAAAAPWEGRFDVLVSYDSYAFFDTFALIDALRPERVVGFNKGPYRLFDLSLDDGRHGIQRRPIASRVEWLMKTLEIDLPLSDLAFHVPIGPGEQAEVAALVAGPRPWLLLNTYGAAAPRSLTPDSVARALEILDWPGTVFLSVPAGKESEFAALAGPRVVVAPPLSGFMALFALVARMDAVVSPDSAVAHIAAAFDKPQVCLFKDRLYNPVVWRPMSDRCEVVLSTSGENVNDLDWNEFAAAAERMLGDAPPSS